MATTAELRSKKSAIWKISIGMEKLKMRLAKLFLICLIVALISAVPANAQSQEEAIQEALQQFDEMITKISDFTADVRFTEDDIESYIHHFEEFSSFEGQDDEEEIVDFSDVLADPEYRSWATEQGLDPDMWLRKSTRISMVLMRDQIQAAAEMMRSQYPQQMSMIEEQCKEVDEDICQQMKQAMASNFAMFEKQGKALDRLPEPTAAEQALLVEHADELQAVVMGAEEDEEW